MKWKNMRSLFDFKNFAQKKYSEVFPKVCPGCGIKFSSSEDFFEKTEDSSSEVLEFVADKPIRINLRSRCLACGHIFSFEIDERRDMSKKGCYVRNKFGEILEMLVEEGMDRGEARKEVLKMFFEQETDYKEKKVQKFCINRTKKRN